MVRISNSPKFPCISQGKKIRYPAVSVRQKHIVSEFLCYLSHDREYSLNIAAS